MRLISIFQSATMQCRPPNVQYASTLADGVPKSPGLETTQFLPCPMLLSIQGVIRHKYICPSWLHPVKAYLCFASDCKITCTDAPLCPKECLSGWFQEMLLALAKNRKSLVCVCFFFNELFRAWNRCLPTSQNALLVFLFGLWISWTSHLIWCAGLIGSNSGWNL